MKAIAILFFVISILINISATAQQDSISRPSPQGSNMSVGRESVPIKKTDTLQKRLPFQPNPKKAGLYSVLLPGSGQLYNRQYWKVPVIYAGFGIAGYFIASNYSNYNHYRKAYIAVIDQDQNTVSTELYGEADLKQLQDQYKEWLDMTVLLTSLGYMLQVMDAVVYAHLKNFDITPDISMRMQPVAMPNGGAGFGLVLNLK